VLRPVPISAIVPDVRVHREFVTALGAVRPNPPNVRPGEAKPSAEAAIDIIPAAADPIDAAPWIPMDGSVWDHAPLAATLFTGSVTTAPFEYRAIPAKSVVRGVTAFT
jgi:hypothetical protein